LNLQCHRHHPAKVSGLIDTAHYWSAVPLWDYVRLRSDPAPDFSEYGSGSSQNYTDLPPWSALSLTQKIDFIVEYLREYEVICKKALTRWPRAQMELFDEKNQRSKIL
jgi:hypothetical protein